MSEGIGQQTDRHVRWTDGYEQHKVNNVNMKLSYYTTRSLDLSQGSEPGPPATGERVEVVFPQTT